MKLTNIASRMTSAPHVICAASIAVMATMAAEPSAAAEGHGGWHGGFHAGTRAHWHEWHGDWHGPHFGGDVRLFDDHDLGLWRAGRWAHEWHDGRLAWWWVAGGMWYYYAAPVYPYPDPYAPPEAVAATPHPPVGADLPPQPQNWYHCSSPDGYYPYVATCPSGWRAVPAHSGQPKVADTPAVSAR
jgi:hypothetical protein